MTSKNYVGNSNKLHIVLLLILFSIAIPIIVAASLLSSKGRVSQSSLPDPTIPAAKTCPVSSQLNLTSPARLFHYPTEIYFQNITNEAHTGPLLKCQSNSEIDDKKWYLCPLQSTNCPLSDLIVNIAINKSKSWLLSSSICESFSQKQKINILILGGSVTAGHHSYGCSSSCHKDFCQEKTSISTLPSCSWSMYLAGWIKSYFSPIEVQVVTLAQSGLTSGVMAKSLSLKLNEYNISLSKDDIVIIDHSTNDALSSGHGEIEILRSGLEELVNNIYHLATRGSVKKIPPTIILLEFYPLRNYQREIPKTWNEINQDGFDYGEVYYDIASRYHLHLWSLRDVIWSPFIENTILLDYLKGYWGVHPPWHVHLFYADLISSALKASINSCPFNESSNLYLPSTTIPSEYNKFIQRRGIITCANSPTIYMSSPTTISKYNITLQNFHFLKEKSRNFGWVSRYNPHPSLSKDHFIRIHTDRLSSRKFLIQIQYLMTYVNAGIFQIFLCGTQISQIDTLWDDFQRNRISIPQLFQFLYDSDFHSFCDETFILLEIKHIFDSQEDKSLARTNYQKIRIDSIVVCSVKEDERTEVRRS